MDRERGGGRLERTLLQRREQGPCSWGPWLLGCSLGVVCEGLGCNPDLSPLTQPRGGGFLR